MRQKVWFYKDEVESWLKSFEEHRDGLKGRAWILEKMITEVRETMRKRINRSAGGVVDAKVSK